MNFDEQTLRNLSLTQYEYDLLVERLGREPNYIELGLLDLYGVSIVVTSIRNLC